MRRLTAKLDEIDEKIAALSRMRAGVERALVYELWEEGRLAPLGGGPMPLPPPRGDAATFASTMLEAR